MRPQDWTFPLLMRPPTPSGTRRPGESPWLIPAQPPSPAGRGRGVPSPPRVLSRGTGAPSAPLGVGGRQRVLTPPGSGGEVKRVPPSRSPPDRPFAEKGRQDVEAIAF